MVRFGRDYPGAAVDQLGDQLSLDGTDRRSFVAVAPRMGASEGMLTLALDADRGVGPSRPEIRRFETLDDEAAGARGEHPRARRRRRAAAGPGRALPDQRTPRMRSPRRWKPAAFPVLHLGSLFEREEVRDLLCLLSLAVDPFGDAHRARGRDAALRPFAAGRVLRLPAPAVAREAGACRPCRSVGGAGLVNGRARGRRAAGQQTWPACARTASAWDFLATYLLDRTDLGEAAWPGATASPLGCARSPSGNS